MASNNRNPYPFHAPTAIDANHAYCMTARATLARLRAKRSNIVVRMFRAILGK